MVKCAKPTYANKYKIIHDKNQLNRPNEYETYVLHHFGRTVLIVHFKLWTSARCNASQGSKVRISEGIKKLNIQEEDQLTEVVDRYLDSIQIPF